jgi:uncharacterized protein (DUF1684 family)
MRSSVFVILLSGIIFLYACKEKKKYHDSVDSKITSSSQVNSLKEILDFQKEKNAEFRNPETSPLPDRYRKDFDGLDFFAPDTTYVVTAKLIRTPEALPFMMPTTTDRKSEEVVYGIAHFTLNGVARQLEIYQNKELMLEEEYVDYLFLPFTDLTNAEETYGGGRYIDLRIPKGNMITIDFNRAYNPSCAYNTKYSCPLVPSVNHLGVRVLAGVKAFKKGYN